MNHWIKTTHKFMNIWDVFRKLTSCRIPFFAKFTWMTNLLTYNLIFYLVKFLILINYFYFHCCYNIYYWFKLHWVILTLILWKWFKFNSNYTQSQIYLWTTVIARDSLKIYLKCKHIKKCKNKLSYEKRNEIIKLI